jgi:hypothetical protein
MTRRTSFDAHPKELAYRRSGTADVALLWSRRLHRAAVVVDDEGSGDHFELDIGPGDDPLDIYQHPYAYAAARAA